jgi:hypothetical protein
MRQVRREASKGETIVITNSLSEFFGKRFVVSYTMNGSVAVDGIEKSFKHHEYEVLEIDTSALVADYVRKKEIDYELMVLNEAIELDDLAKVVASKERLRELLN